LILTDRSVVRVDSAAGNDPSVYNIRLKKLIMKLKTTAGVKTVFSFVLVGGSVCVAFQSAPTHLNHQHRNGFAAIRRHKQSVPFQVSGIKTNKAKGILRQETTSSTSSLFGFTNPFTALLDNVNTSKSGSGGNNKSSKKQNAVTQYFDAFNDRDMERAVNCCAPDIEYDDTQYPEPFQGRDSLRNHLFKVANALPSTIQFVVDDMSQDVSEPDQTKVGVQWHLENSDNPGQTLPFSRGCSFYYIDKQSGLIAKGFDVPEPAPFKAGSAGITILSVATKLIEEPVRVLPLAVWITYMYVVFFSNGILPGADATQLEPRTWEEVRDLSLNFFFVAPVLNLPFSPHTVHPMLEGVFNLLLSWAALFAGFMTDDRPTNNKANTIPFFPQTLVGMQALTSAIFLPYLVTRTSESSVLRPNNTSISSDDTNNNNNNMVVYQEDLTTLQSVVGESRALGGFLAAVGTVSLGWAGWARADEYGVALSPERWQGFMDLLSIDRVGCSFLVDLAIFAIFQGWLVEDDMKRRSNSTITTGAFSSRDQLLINVATYVPFFGLAAYLMVRPALPCKNETT
jgi:hypothetical protein